MIAPPIIYLTVTVNQYFIYVILRQSLDKYRVPAQRSIFDLQKKYLDREIIGMLMFCLSLYYHTEGNSIAAKYQIYIYVASNF